MRACSLLVVAMLAGLCGLAGCSSAATRSGEGAGASGARSVAAQPRVAQGHVNIGDTAGMVTIVMGRPDEKREVAGTNGDLSVWVYRIHQKGQDQEPTGWSEVLVPAVIDQNETVVHEAITREIYRTEGEVEIHVAFAAGFVSSVQQQEH